MIILDLEWNQLYAGAPIPNEILQIGAVRISALDGVIQDTFNAYIRPTIKKNPASRTKKMLPDIQESLKSEIGFPEAYRAFLDWVGNEQQFVLWGGDDFIELTRECKYWNQPFFVPEKILNLQKVFSCAVGESKRAFSLEDAAMYCGIPTCFEFHNALNDAMYTAMVGMVLRSAKGFWKQMKTPSRPKPKMWSSPLLDQLGLSHTPYKPKPAVRIGPYRLVGDIKDNVEVRDLSCPVCGKSIKVQPWLFSSTQGAFSTANCPEHGKFLCRLLLKRLSRNWSGIASIPFPKEDLLLEYLQAKKAGVTQPPRKGGKKRKKKRNRNGKKAA